MNTLTCFEQQAINGIVGKDLDESTCQQLGYAIAIYLEARCLVVGGDNRLSTPILKQALIKGIKSTGCHIIDIGVCGSEEVCYANSLSESDGTVMVTGGAQPKVFNGIKITDSDNQCLSHVALKIIKELVQGYEPPMPSSAGQLVYQNYSKAYIKHILSFVDTKTIKPLRIVVNAGNGCAGNIINALETEFLARQIPLELVKLNNQPDGEFPHGAPDPQLIHNQQKTSDAVKRYRADLGLAWDGDFKRCFFFDAQGNSIENYYIVALLAQEFAQQHPAQKIIHDPSLIWNTQDAVHNAGGKAIECRSGQVPMTHRMRQEQAVYGGEIDAHHYFKDFFYCESGMIPWLMIVGLLSSTNQSLSELVNQQMLAYPTSGQINSKVDDATSLLDDIEQQLAGEALDIKHTDGLSMSFSNWRFNLKRSSHYSSVKLNVESRGDIGLMQQQTHYLLQLIQGANA